MYTITVLIQNSFKNFVRQEMLRRYLIATLTLVAIARSDNIGWKGYFVESPQEFHDIPLVWESGNTTVPSWLTGIFVKNGPAQVSFYYIES